MATPPTAPVYKLASGQVAEAVGTFVQDASNNIVSNGPPGSAWTAITPNDVTVLSGLQFLRVGVGGNLSIKAPSGAAAVVVPVLTGEYVPFTGGIVMNAGTTATGIVAVA